jgi:hypothetical protein
MWPDFVVMATPGGNDFSGVIQISEPVLIQTAVPEAPVEAFHERILELELTRFHGQFRT